MKIKNKNKNKKREKKKKKKKKDKKMSECQRKGRKEGGKKYLYWRPYILQFQNELEHDGSINLGLEKKIKMNFSDYICYS